MSRHNRLKVDLVEKEILRMIEVGELHPGTPLQQREIARRLGVSPTPVREAFRRLETAGILVSSSRTGVRVADPLFPADEPSRRVLSVLLHVAAELTIAHASDDDILELRALNLRYRKASSTEAHDLHWQLHLRIAELAQSPVLVSHLRMLWSLLETGTTRTRSRVESADHHDSIIDAIDSRDIETAQHLMDEHQTRRASTD